MIDRDGRGYAFKLQGKVAVPCSIMEWSMAFEDYDARRVGETYVGVLRVSTVFVGLDMSFGGDDPLLFETMIFDDGEDGYQVRSATWADAEDIHARAVAIATERVRAADADIRAAARRIRDEIMEALAAKGVNVKKGEGNDA